MKTPSYYVAPLRSRAEIVAFLKQAANERPQYGIVAINVKLYHVDLSFDHLLAMARKEGFGYVSTASPRYVAACRLVHEEIGESTLCDYAIEGARDGAIDDDGYRLIWNEDKIIADWAFDGRSSGWLVLQSFEGINMVTGNGYGDAILDDLDFRTLRRLYRFIVQSRHDFRREAVRESVEYAAAFMLFENLCHTVEIDEQEAKRLEAERSEANERAHWEARDTVTA